MLQQDVFTLPMESFPYVEGKLSKKTGVSDTDEVNVKLVNNAIAFLFEEIRYELADVEVDRTKNVGIASTLKTMLSIGKPDVDAMKNAGWVASTTNKVTPKGNNGEFNFCVPLRMLMGFAEDFTRIILNMKQELILLCTSTNLNAMVMTTTTSSATTANADLELTKILWIVPYVHVNNDTRLELMRKDPPLSIPFRSWELHEYPALLTTSRQTWTIKTSLQLEKPRVVILTFQTARKIDLKKHGDEFDHSKVTNARLFLNDKYYPYDNLNFDIDNGRFALLYDMYGPNYKIHYNNLCQCISQYSTGYRKFLFQLLHHITVKQYGAIRVDRMLCSYAE